jgi:hypothetical protein
MQPAPGPRRRNLRRTLRGIPAGRRTTHPVETAYGHKQRERDRLAMWAAAIAAVTTSQGES